MSEASEAGRGHSKGTSFHRPRTDAGAETNAASPWPGLQPQEPRENKCLLFNPPSLGIILLQQSELANRHPEREAPFCPCLLEFYGYCNGD